MTPNDTAIGIAPSTDLMPPPAPLTTPAMIVISGKRKQWLRRCRPASTMSEDFVSSSWGFRRCIEHADDQQLDAICAELAELYRDAWNRLTSRATQ